MELIRNTSRLEELLNRYTAGAKFSNSYMLLDEMKAHVANGRLYYIEQESTGLLLFLRNEGFFRAYYYLKGLKTKIELPAGQTIVQELIYRGPGHYPEAEINFWEGNGFQKYLGRDNYFLNARDLDIEEIESKLQGVDIQFLQSDEEIDRADQLIRTYLDPYTGDILTKEELMKFSANDELMGVFSEGNLAGVLQAELKNKVLWLGHMVVDEAYRGKKLSVQLLMAYFQNGLALSCRQFQLWVINDNAPALGLYKKYGFKFLNKSTISLLKK